MIRLKLKLECTSGDRKKKINVQDSYSPIIVPSAAVLVSTEVTQSTAALPRTPGRIFYEANAFLEGASFMYQTSFKRNSARTIDVQSLPQCK